MSTQKNILLTALIITTGAMPAANASSEHADARRWQFDVLLDDKPIGVHTFAVEDTGTALRLETAASFDVKFLFITAFRYRHQNTEVWQDGCLSSIDAVTDSNGKELVVRGRRDGGDFDIAQTDSTKTLPGCVQTFAYWNPAVLESEQLLNSQTGEYESVAVTYEGPDEVSLGGQAIAALRYTLATRGGDITLWYSRDDLTWLGLEAPAKGGRTLAYRPTRVPLGALGETSLARRD